MNSKKGLLLSNFIHCGKNRLLPLAEATLVLALTLAPAAYAHSPTPAGPPQSPVTVCAKGGTDSCVTSLYVFSSNPNYGSSPGNGVSILPNGGFILPLVGAGGSPYGDGSIGVVAELYPQASNTLQEFVLGTFAPAGAAPSVTLMNNPSGSYTFDGATWFGGACGLGGMFEVKAPATATGSVTFTNLYNNFSNGNGRYYNGDPTPSGGNSDVCSVVADDDHGSVPAAVLPLTGGTLLVTTQQGGKYSSGTLSRFVPNGKGGYTQYVDYIFSSYDKLNGNLPYGPLVQTNASTVYGVTLTGGDPNNPVGTLYRATQSESGAWTVTPAYIFPNSEGNSPNGASPIGLSEGPDGNIYVATYTGGWWAGGTIGRFIPATGQYQVLLHMGKTPSDLSFPLTPPLVVADKNNNLHIFITGSNGGNLNTNDGYGSGGVGAIAGTNSLVSLWNFTSGADGAYPSGSILFNSRNNTGIVTLLGGGNSNGDGALTKVSLPMTSSTVYQASKQTTSSEQTTSTAPAQSTPSASPHYGFFCLNCNRH